MVDREKKAAGTAEADISTELCGIRLDNPVIPASGTFGYGREFNEFYDINCLGTFSFKGTTLEPRFGNPTPRIAECPDGMINAVGLQNPGVEKVISEELPALAEIFHKPVMANVSGFSVSDYAKTVEKLEADEADGTKSTSAVRMCMAAAWRSEPVRRQRQRSRRQSEK